MVTEIDKASKNIAKNLSGLRNKAGFTQKQLALLSGVTRASIAQLESGDSNPTLEILLKLCQGLRISIEELLSSPRAECRLTRAADVPVDRRSKQGILLRKLLPDQIPGTEIDELYLEANSVLTGTPHIEGTREYFTCVRGEILIGVLGEKFQLKKGDVLSFPGHQPHSYKNIGAGQAQGISVVLLNSLS